MTPDTREERVGRSLAYRAAADGTPETLAGYAAVFNVETVIAGLFREVIKPGAFTEAIGRDNVRALFNHDPNFVLGRTPKTLTLAEDTTGLSYAVVPPDATWAKDLVASIARGDITQSSFAFRVVADAWPPVKRDEMPLREIRAVELFDVSPVTYPAYDTTSVAARAQVAVLSEQITAHIRRRNRLLRATRESIGA